MSRSTRAHAKSTRTWRIALPSIRHAPGRQKCGDRFPNHPGLSTGGARDRGSGPALLTASPHAPPPSSRTGLGGHDHGSRSPLSRKRRSRKSVSRDHHGTRPAGGGKPVTSVAESPRNSEQISPSGWALRPGTPRSRPARASRTTRPRGRTRSRGPRGERGGPTRGLRRTPERNTYDLRTGPTDGQPGRTGRPGTDTRTSRGRTPRLSRDPAGRLPALGTATGGRVLQPPARAHRPGSTAAAVVTRRRSREGAPFHGLTSQLFTSVSLPRNRNTALVCNWQTRDSVTPSTLPISASVRFSK